MKEFDKWIRGHNSIPAFPRYTTKEEDIVAKEAWEAALRMIKSEGVISDYELAGKIIKDELKEK